jgi:hypothetical protein
MGKYEKMLDELREVEFKAAGKEQFGKPDAKEWKTKAENLRGELFQLDPKRAFRDGKVIQKEIDGRIEELRKNQDQAEKLLRGRRGGRSSIRSL